MINGMIAGPKLSGKTTLAKHLADQFWKIHLTRTLVFDPNNEVWPKSCWVTTKEEKFWPAIWTIQDCLVIVDEAATTINRDRDLVEVFTRLRHQRHRLLIIGHSGRELLPTMREQMDEIFLFRQTLDAADIWRKVFTEDGLLESQFLSQYEFIHHRMFGTPEKLKLDLTQADMVEA